MAWQVDTAHTQIAFAIRHLGISLIRGNFRLADAELELDENKPESAKLSARIDASTLDTRDANRDGHLMSPDFLNVETYPYIEFRTSEVTQSIGGKFRVRGDLTVRDVTRPVDLQGEYSGPVGDPVSGKRKVGFLMTGDISQKDWGIEWNVPMDGGFMLGDRVTLTIDAQAIEQ
jgi:polyisoprenoid-binding protein YceI